MTCPLSWVGGLRVARLFPDVVLKAFGKAYPAHRVILASQSAYFATLWSWVSWQPASGRGCYAEEEWSSLPSHDLVLGEDVTQKGFEWILEYFYASPTVIITSENAFDVLAAAHYLGVIAVQTACVEFVAQHLDPHNLAACLLWATRADHGEASDMLASSCRRLLALRLPQNLSAWAPALARIEPRILLDIMSSDHLAVPTEYDRYELVKEVAKICAAAAAAAPSGALAAAAATTAAEETAGGGAEGGADGAIGAGGDGHSGGGASGTLEVQRMLTSALRLSDEGLAGHLELARSCSSAGLPCPGLPPTVAAAKEPATAAASASAAVDCTLPRRCLSSSASLGSVAGDADSDASLVGSASPAASALGTSSSECTSVDVASVLTSSQASSRSTLRLCELAVPTTPEEHRIEDAVTDTAGKAPCKNATVVVATAAVSSPPLRSHKTQGSNDSSDVVDVPQRAISMVTAGSSVAATTAAAAVAACARMLLHEAVRYEHLTVPQLMAVMGEGLVPANVLHTALWERTRLDVEVHARSSQAAAATGERAGTHSIAGGAGGGSRSGRVDAAEAVPVGALVRPLRFRAFRMCWRLPCGALRKLQPKDVLQSDLHQHAGSLWHLRVCCSDRSRDHLGLFVGRHLAGAAVGNATGLLRLWQGARLSPARQMEPAGREAGGQQPHRLRPGRRGRLQPPQEHPLIDPVPPPPMQQWQQRQHAALSRPFFAYTDQNASLRGRCRLSVFQSDNTALQGRLCLGDTGDFTADFAAGGYFGQGQLIARADLARLPDEQEMLVFMSLQVPVDTAE
ncbi:hypothetical protein VOLCADRAFT_89185 [Volvox carteri f. nagariensis]|uniref:BTB domain-containing protein n=1 Tax=Volvox carteri f. nagariensis TaxID=3068 RepID=D8TR10_VOLCA|nr:uncharacterized protein VOLCADRAFT_89185 [Volvox carteri f. nagariensis]EFJ50119.1 hypothetical protein VOLCADRAFT_89185 [Volvox carteri f. nagariensis]|eukprot:XP_002948739.1 hypothetical protein VOLCADRAFT_89185 [Volvox carteri f. nagariensis]